MLIPRFDHLLQKQYTAKDEKELQVLITGINAIIYFN